MFSAANYLKGAAFLEFVAHISIDKRVRKASLRLLASVIAAELAELDGVDDIGVVAEYLSSFTIETTDFTINVRNTSVDQVPRSPPKLRVV